MGIRPDAMRWVGSPAQLYGIEDFRLIGGRAQGMRCMRMYNAEGLSLTVLPDRGMDIGQFSICGKNLSFLSCTGPVNSTYFAEDGARGFFRNFLGGFLTTGGLTYMGAACTDENEALGLHGVIANLPAQEVCGTSAGGNLRVSGSVRQARVFGENLVLRRCIELPYGEKEFSICDEIENQGFRTVPFMLLYHMNFGYPFLSTDTKVYLPSCGVHPRDAQAQGGLPTYLSMDAPQDGRPEQVFFHEMQPDEQGNVHFMLEALQEEMAICVSYPYRYLPCFTQWKSMASGEYALGLEPGNCHVLGRVEAKRDGSLRTLEPGDCVRLKLTVRVICGNANIRNEQAKLQLGERQG